MKINKYFLGLAAIALGVMTSCNTDVEGDRYTTNLENVSFEIAKQTVSLPTDQSSVTVPVLITRSVLTNATSISYTAVASEDGIFTNDGGGVLNFAEGQNAVTLNITANNVEKEKTYTYTITLDDYAIASADTVSKARQNTQFVFTVSREGDWVSIGTGLYREDLLTTFWSVDNLIYQVEVREHETQKGIYRIVNPYDGKYENNDEGDWDTSKDYYIQINAQNPDFVYVESGELGLDWGYGMISITNYAQYLADANGITIDDVMASRPDLFGKLKDGIITMPANSMLISMSNYKDGNLYYTNGSGLFAVALPGHKFADYSSELTYAGVMINPQNEVFAVANLTLGADAKTVKAVIVPDEGDTDPAAVADALAAGDLEGYDVEAGQISVPMPADANGKMLLVVAVIADDEVKSYASANFEYFGGGGGNPWKSLGTGYLTDNMFITGFYEDTSTKTIFAPKTYEVEIQENQDTPGLYRIINAFSNAAALLGRSSEYVASNLEVNATDPNGVYFLPQAVGLGDYTLSSYGGYWLARGGEGNDFESLKADNCFGILQSGHILFPQVAYVDENKEPTGEYFQGILQTNGHSFYVGWLDATNDVQFEIVLPGASAEAKAKARSKVRATNFENRLKGSMKLVNSKSFDKKYRKASKTLKKNLKLHTAFASLKAKK